MYDSNSFFIISYPVTNLYPGKIREKACATDMARAVLDAITNNIVSFNDDIR